MIMSIPEDKALT